jgi:hypothetical protein
LFCLDLEGKKKKEVIDCIFCQILLVFRICSAISFYSTVISLT